MQAHTDNHLFLDRTPPPAAQETLATLIEQSRDFDSRKADYEGLASTFRFDDRARISQEMQTANLLTPSPDGIQQVLSTPFALTDWAFGQLLAKLGPTLHGDGSSRTIGKADMEALKTRFPALFAGLFNGLLGQTNHGRKLVVRTYENHARAVLSSKYAIVQNTRVLEGVAEIIANPANVTEDLKVVRSYVNPDEMHVRIVWKDVPGKDGGRGNYGIGVYVGNGETGGNSLRVTPLIQRHSCVNSIILDEMGGIRLRHIGDPRALIAQIRVSMLNMLPLAAEQMDVIYRAEEEAIPSFSDVVAGLAKQHGWSDSLKSHVLIGTEGQTTRMGLVNGITYAAKKTGDIGREADMEALGGKILAAPGSLFEQAARKARALVERE